MKAITLDPAEWDWVLNSLRYLVNGGHSEAERAALVSITEQLGPAKTSPISPVDDAVLGVFTDAVGHAILAADFAMKHATSRHATTRLAAGKQTLIHLLTERR